MFRVIMELFKAKLITYTIAFGLVISGCVGVVLYNYFPDLISWNWFSIVALFFLIAETCIMLYVSEVSKKKEKRQMVNVYMLIKIAKILASFVIAGIYLAIDKTNIQGFVIVFILFYLLYLVAETSLFVTIEKHIKENKK